MRALQRVAQGRIRPGVVGAAGRASTDVDAVRTAVNVSASSVWKPRAGAAAPGGRRPRTQRLRYVDVARARARWRLGGEFSSKGTAEARGTRKATEAATAKVERRMAKAELVGNELWRIEEEEAPAQPMNSLSC